MKGRLLADYAVAFNFFGLAETILDNPVARDQLNDGLALVRDAHGVRKEEVIPPGIALLLDVLRFDSHSDILGQGLIHAAENA